MTARLVSPAACVALVLALSACQPVARATPPQADAPAAPATTGMKHADVPPQPMPPQSPMQAVLTIGGDAPIANGRLRLLNMVSDSRCPKGAQCIWEGEVTLAFEFADGAGKHAFQLARRAQPTAGAGAVAFHLEGYGACPAGVAAAPAECATVTAAAASTR